MQGSPIVPLLVLGLVAAVIFSGVTPWSVVGAMPLIFMGLDSLLGTMPAPANNAAISARWPLILFVPAQYAFLIAAIVTAPRQTIGDIAGVVIASGMTFGIFGMLTAHELIHSRRRFERALGTVALTSVFYAHFRISHVFGHHRFAGTRDDPASARHGEGAYRFALRSAWGQARFAYRFERRFVIAAAAIGAAMLAADFWAAGWRGVACHAGIAAVAILILEIFNYVVHYGLTRRDNEPFSAAHSWNVAHRFSNWALLNGGLHAAHHRAPARDHATLRAEPDMLSLPGGFGVTLCLALLPPLWRKVMDRRVASTR
ncbi:MAG TPA: alkane 1-monooxygenase [Stellaceae bacterium]